MRPTQSSQILRHMEVYGSITPIEALQQYRCFRLAARICEIRKTHTIACDLSEGFARYSIAVPIQTELQLS